jgi:hypothetical protein
MMWVVCIVESRLEKKIGYDQHANHLYIEDHLLRTGKKKGGP